MALLDTKDEQEVWSKQHKDGDKDASPVSVGTGADGGASEEVELCDASTHLINGGGDGAPPPDSASSTVTTASADKLDSAPARPASPAGSRLSVYKLDYGVEVADSGCCKSKSKRILRKIRLPGTRMSVIIIINININIIIININIIIVIIIIIIINIIIINNIINIIIIIINNIIDINIIIIIIMNI